MLKKFRASKYYKICGFVCGILSVIILLLTYSLLCTDFFKGENILIALPLVPVLFLILFIDALVFVILTCQAFTSANSKENNNNNKTEVNIIADIAYLFTTVFMLFAGLGYCYIGLTQLK